MSKKTKIYDSQAGYDLWASQYDEKLAFLNSFEGVQFAKMLGDLKGKKVLDLGCGTGRLTDLLLNNGGEVSGIDVSEKMLEVARKKYPWVNFAQADAENLPFKDDEFDVVVSAFVIVHFKDLQKLFDEVCRVLKSGGIFVLTNINQKKAPKLKLKNGEEIIIKSFYHIPKHVIKDLEHSFFKIEKEQIVEEKGVWINQLIKARKI